MEDVIFDGKWTNVSEWKQSSHNFYSYDDVVIHLRTAHMGNYIYVFVDPINDLTLDSKKDQAMICFDAKNNKNQFHDLDDFCFSVSLDNTVGNVYQGTSLDTSMQKITNPENFIAISSTSDENDRYSNIPHPSYEFRIPIDLLERSDNYGFYLSVYDSSLDKFYSWPKDSTQNNLTDFPAPSTWGDIISPDKSLPEIHFPLLILILLISVIVILQTKFPAKIFTSS